MKKCPQCGREYDSTMTFCLDDGAELLYGPASMDEPQTAILPDAGVTGESPTRTLDLEGSAKTAVLPNPDNAKRPAPSRKRKIVAAAGLLAIVAIAVGGYWMYGGVSSEQIDSIAVMPFSSIGADADSSYLSDGLTESIIYDLSKLPQLKVLPASTVFRYKGKDIDAASVGNEMGVRAVLVSRITQRGDDLQISTELIDALHNKVIWGEIYDRKLTDAISIQKEISRVISEKLRLKLSGEDERKVTKEYTGVPEAYQEFLKGRYQLAKRTSEGIRSSIDHFERAVALDPNYAKAWSGLADAHLLLPQYSDAPLLESLEKAKIFASKAIDLDPDLADARASLALILKVEGDFSGAEASYKKAIELDPKYAAAHHWYSLLLTILGRNTEALREIRTALELEPLSLVINRNYASALYHAGMYKEAEEQARKTKEMDPGFAQTASLLGMSLTHQKRFSEASEVLQKAAESGDLEANIYLAITQALAGNKAEARKQLDIILRSESPDTARLGMLYAALGENSKALDLLERAYEEKSNSLLFVRYDPTVKSLENEPRYKDLMKRIGYPR